MSEKETAMMDITRKLELLANLKTGALWPIELGPELGKAANWGTAVSAICAEALAEIQRLRALCQMPQLPQNFDAVINVGAAVSQVRSNSATGTTMQKAWPHVFSPQPQLSGKTATQVIVDDPKSDPEPEPWGSSFAMNTENWK